jgi:hypothetical protein
MLLNHPHAAASGQRPDRHEQVRFAVASIRDWWKSMGQPTYPGARELLITADGGGSNGYRLRLWKLELQTLADECGLAITVCHLPPGTSKWNKSNRSWNVCLRTVRR